MVGSRFPRQPFTTAELNALALSRKHLRRALESGEVVRVVRGAYLPAEVELTQLVRAQAAALVIGATAVLCDRTAAWVLGVDCLRYTEHDCLPPLESCVLPGHEPTERRELVGRTRDLRPEDVVDVGRVRVTSPLRTAADLLCLLPRREALAAADALMRAYGFTVADLQRLLVRYFRRRGVIQARQLAPLVDGRSESSGESWVRLEIADQGLPPPQPQWWVSVDGVPTYRLDLAYPRARIAIEYDGEQFHSRREDRERDACRRDWLRCHGWTVIVLTKDCFTEAEIQRWISQLRSCLAAY